MFAARTAANMGHAMKFTGGGSNRMNTYFAFAVLSAAVLGVYN